MEEFFSFSDDLDGLGFGDLDNPFVGGVFASLPLSVDHVTNGLALLPSQFNDSEILKTVLQIYLEEFQEIEDTLVEILSQRNLDNAIGTQLDGIGDIVGRRRDGLSDTEYRKFLKVQQLLNSSEGQYTTILKLWRILTGSDSATISEEFPAGVSLFSDVGVPPLEYIQLLSQALPITVTLSLVSSIDADPVFCFEGGDGLGFGTTEDNSIGGKLLGRYTNLI